MTVKRGRKGAVLCAFENQYNTPVPLSNADFQLLRRIPIVERQYLDLGERAKHNISAAQRAGTRKSGVSGAFQVEAWVRARNDLAQGPPLDIHHFLVASGMRSFQPTDARTWAYEPWIPQDVLSISCDVYAHEGKTSLSGCYCPTWELKATAGGMLEFSGTVIGVYNGTEDVEPPVPLEADLNETLPVKFDGLGIPVGSSIGSWKPKVRSFSLRFQRDYALRKDGNSTGTHQGFMLGAIPRGVGATLSIEVEAVDLNEFNPHTVMAFAEPMTVTQSFATGDQWWYVASEQAQLMKVDYSGTAGTHWVLHFQLQNRQFARSAFWLWCSQITPTPQP